MEDIPAADVAEAVHMSSFYFQRGFKIVTGYTVGEYLRNRRLYLAGLDVIKGDERIIDISCRYGYDTPESFTRAFTRFHGVSPMQLKAQPFRIRTFLPLTVEIAIRGGEQMEYTVEKTDAMKMIGNMYKLGSLYGGEDDLEKAIEWYQKAADLGNSDAQSYLERLQGQ